MYLQNYLLVHICTNIFYIQASVAWAHLLMCDFGKTVLKFWIKTSWGSTKAMFLLINPRRLSWEFKAIKAFIISWRTVVSSRLPVLSWDNCWAINNCKKKTVKQCDNFFQSSISNITKSSQLEGNELHCKDHIQWVVWWSMWNMLTSSWQ